MPKARGSRANDAVELCLRECGMYPRSFVMRTLIPQKNCQHISACRDRSRPQNDLRCLAASRRKKVTSLPQSTFIRAMSKALLCSEKGPSPTSYSLHCHAPSMFYGVQSSEKHRFLAARTGVITSRRRSVDGMGVRQAWTFPLFRRKTPH